mgnify:FL=1
MFYEYSDIDETTSLEERLDVYSCLISVGWSHEEAEAVTGLDCSTDLDESKCSISVLVPTVGGIH